MEQSDLIEFSDRKRPPRCEKQNPLTENWELDLETSAPRATWWLISVAGDGILIDLDTPV